MQWFSKPEVGSSNLPKHIINASVVELVDTKDSKFFTLSSVKVQVLPEVVFINWGCISIGRISALHADGCRFESYHLQNI